MDQTISLDYGQGVDTKTDPKLVVSTKFQMIQNGIFTNTKRLSKRNGYDSMTNSMLGGGVWSNPQMVKSYRNEVVLAASASNGKRLVSYSDALSCWKDCGKYVSVGVSKTAINSLEYTYPDETFFDVSSFDTTGVYNSSGVVSGNLGLFVFDGFAIYGIKDGGSNSPNATYFTITDLETGTHLADTVKIPLALGFSKAAVLGPSTFAVFYISSSSTNRLAFRIISISQSGGVSLGSEIHVGTCAALSTLTNQFPYCYDVSTTATGAIVAVANEPNLDLYTISNTGSVSSATVISSTGNITPVTTELDLNGNVWVYWISAGTNLYYAIYSSTLSSVLGATLIAGSLSKVAQLVAVPNFGGVTSNQQIYYSQYVHSDTASEIIIPNISTALVSSLGGVGTSSTFLNGVDLYGKSFMIGTIGNPGTAVYLPVITLSQLQSTGFIVDISDGIAIAKFLQTEAEGIYQAGNGVGAASTNPAALIGTRFPGFMNSPYTLPDGTTGIAAGIVVQINSIVSSLFLGTSTNLQCSPLNTTFSVQYGTVLIGFNFSDIDAYQGLIQQDTLVLNGGIVSIYDGAYVSELGYSVDPDLVGLTAVSSGGNQSAGTYIYYLTWEWNDANGNQYESAPSLGAEVIFTTGTANSVEIVAAAPILSSKQNMVAKLWRSDSNLGGNLAYLIAILPAIGSNYPLVSFTDTNASGSGNTLLTGGETLYTENGAILENIAPPPSLILWTNNNRLWAIDSENQETNIEYSKTASSGTGISFSTGQLEIVIDSKSGEITGASPMDEKTVILKQNGLGYFIGDGANDAGTNSTITNFQFIPSDTGCTNSKSIILYPEGILYRTPKGIYQVSRGVQSTYFGLDVEAYNSQDIQSAFIVPNRNQIRFLTSSGSSLLYDYVMGQWSVFTNHAGLSANSFGGLYVYVRSDGTVYLEDESSFLDNTNAYQLSVQTAWIALGSVQGFERVKYMLMLGDYENGTSTGHGMSIQAANDFQSAVYAAVPYLFGLPSSSSFFQYRNFFRRQKCDSISLFITEITTGASGEYVDISNMSFRALIKDGLNRLPQTQSVG